MFKLRYSSGASAELFQRPRSVWRPEHLAVRVGRISGVVVCRLSSGVP
jgi:hypothetical protein